MEEDKYGFVQDGEVEEVILRFEKMKKSNQSCYFDVIEFEAIIDYYLDVNNSMKAFEAMSFACELHPNSVPIQIRKARVLLEKGRALEALSICKRVENIEPGNYEIHICKGTALAMLGDISGAKKMFDLALQTEEDDEENILFNITSVLQNLNYYDHIIPYLHRLAELEPDFQAHIYDLAFAYDRNADYPNSIQYYRKYLDEEPYSDSAWYNLGIIYNKIEQYPEALEAYDYALAINPDNAFALFNKANILSNMERYSEALDVYQEFVAEEPDSLEGLTYLAECYDKTGDEEMARKYYFEAIELTPEFPDPWYGLGLLSLTREKASESIPYFKRAVNLDENNPDYWFSMGKAYIGTKEIAKALRCFRTTLKLDPYFDDAWLEIGMIILFSESFKIAIPKLEEARKIIGDVPGLSYVLASCYLHLSDYDNGMMTLSRAADLDYKLFPDFTLMFPERLMTPELLQLFNK
jgi:tetratricopeptide (TPR) repeat protein